jgi:hypothetical protein
MDSDALVEEQIELGRKLIGLLKVKGIDVTVAAWVKGGRVEHLVALYRDPGRGREGQAGRAPGGPRRAPIDAGSASPDS